MIPSISCAHTSTFLFGITSDDDDEDEDEDEDEDDDDDEAEEEEASIHKEGTSEHDNEPCGIPFLWVPQ